jgi:hypothetical protein
MANKVSLQKEMKTQMLSRRGVAMAHPNDQSSIPVRDELLELSRQVLFLLYQ